MSSIDQCAIGPDGELLPASNIVFYNDPDLEQLIKLCKVLQVRTVVD